jgi:hypothetical protein
MSAAPGDDRSRSRLIGGLVAVAIMLAPALLFAWYGGAVAGTVLVPGYRDSSDIFYLAYGGIGTLLSLVFATIAGTIVRALTLPWTIRWRIVYLLGTIIPFFIGIGITIFLN